MKTGKPKDTDPGAQRAVGYARVSTGKQDLGIPGQVLEMHRWAADNGVELVRIFEDKGVSGAAEVSKRPGMLEAFAALESLDCTIFLVCTRDRLARSTAVAATAETLAASAGAKIVSVDGMSDDGTPMGEFMKVIQDGISQLMRAQIAMNTARALRGKKAKGLRYNNDAAFGYRFEGERIVEDELEQAAIAAILQWREDGISVRGCVVLLEGNGHRPRGKRWHSTTIHRLLQRIDADRVDGAGRPA